MARVVRRFRRMSQHFVGRPQAEVIRSRVGAFTGQLGDVSLDTTDCNAEICRCAWHQSATHASVQRSERSALDTRRPTVVAGRRETLPCPGCEP